MYMYEIEVHVLDEHTNQVDPILYHMYGEGTLSACVAASERAKEQGHKVTFTKEIGFV